MHYELFIYGRSSEYLQHLVPDLSAVGEWDCIYGGIYIGMYDALLDRDGDQQTALCSAVRENISPQNHSGRKRFGNSGNDLRYACAYAISMDGCRALAGNLYRCHLSHDLCHFLRMVSGMLCPGIQPCGYFHFGRRNDMRLACGKDRRQRFFPACYVYSLDFSGHSFSDSMEKVSPG